MTQPPNTPAQSLTDELRLIGCHSNGDARCTCVIGMEAADRITQLIAENKAAHDLLRRFKKQMPEMYKSWHLEAEMQLEGKE